MGCGGSKDIESKINEQIENQLRKDQDLINEDIKLLLLGAGDSGKSTIVKQMKILFLNGFTSKEKEMYKSIIIDNLKDFLAILINAANHFGVKISQPKEIIESFLNQTIPKKNLPSVLSTLLNDSGIQEMCKRADEINLPEAASYFFQNFERIFSSKYVPSPQDILLSRATTIGITETNFTFSDMKFK
eukprot:Anaeramoba_ignava/c408_g1_i1.p1 GENE.c408_g1_i1~~c408_g1_i1.p1  ORF type:complete len:188 (+),score=65.89 c408_g1_i1:79-642(+)